MDRFAGQFLLQCSVDQLMLADPGQTLEGHRHHTHLKMITAFG